MEDNSTCSLNLTVYHDDCDCFGKLRIVQLCTFMLRLAGLHADKLDVGIDSLQSNQMTWVLTKFCLNIVRLPEKCENISIITWVRGINKFGTERCFAVKDKNDIIIATASSNWAVLDAVTRRPKFLTNLPNSKIETTNLDIMVDSPGKLNFSAIDLSLTDTLQVRNSDIDINTHLYSMKYLEFVLNTLSIREIELISSLTMNFLAEVHLDDTISIHSKELKYEIRNSDSLPVFRAEIVL